MIVKSSNPGNQTKNLSFPLVFESFCCVVINIRILAWVIAPPGIRSVDTLAADAVIVSVVSFTVWSVNVVSASRPLSSRFECHTL